MLHNLKKCDAHFFMQELGKFNFKMDVLPKELKIYMSFSLDNKLLFIDSFQFFEFFIRLLSQKSTR